MHGRKPVLYGGLIVFAIASVGAALAQTVEWLIFFRLIQGLGASTGMVVPRASCAISTPARRPPS